MDKQKQKQVRSNIGGIGGIKPSPVINVNIKKWKNWNSKNEQRTFGNKFEMIDEENNTIGKFIYLFRNALNLSNFYQICFQTEI